MSEVARQRMQGFERKDNLAGISLRHLEVFSTVAREGSYSNAALELQMSRTNVKRVCDEFARIAGRELFSGNGENGCGTGLETTVFGQGVLARLGPLSTSLRKLEEGVRKLHHAGRVLRFGATGGFFRGGLFTDYISRLDVGGRFRSCFLMIDATQAQKSLLAAQCDVYFGLGLGVTERLDRVELGKVGWAISRVGGGKLPKKPTDLGGSWFLVREGDGDVGVGLLGEFRAAGAEGGEIIDRGAAGNLGKGAVVLAADVISPLGTGCGDWPGYQFCALMRRHHPYSDLKGLLCMGAGKEANGL